MKETLGARDQIRTFLFEQHPSKKHLIPQATDLLSQGVLDSLSIVTLVSFLEETFAIQLDYDELTEGNFRTIDAIANLVLHKTAPDIASP